MGNSAVGNPLSGRPCMRERPESLWYLDPSGPSNNPAGLGNPQETRVTFEHRGILRDYTGRDCDVQDIVQPATPALTGGQGKPDAGS